MNTADPTPGQGGLPSAAGPNSEASQLLTAEQLADRWQVKKSTVYLRTREGSIPAVRIGRLYRYRLQAIEQYEIGGGGESDV